MAKDKDKPDSEKDDDSTIHGMAISELTDKVENLENELARLQGLVQEGFSHRPHFDVCSVRLAVVQGAVQATLQQAGIQQLAASPSSIAQYVDWAVKVADLVINRLMQDPVLMNEDLARQSLNPNNAPNDSQKSFLNPVDNRAGAR